MNGTIIEKDNLKTRNVVGCHGASFIGLLNKSVTLQLFPTFGTYVLVYINVRTSASKRSLKLSSCASSTKCNHSKGKFCLFMFKREKSFFFFFFLSFLSVAKL
jgi:hypothetical protein